MSGGFGRGHAYIDSRSRNDGLVVDVEAVGKQEQFAGREVRTNLIGIQFGRGLIRDQDHHNVGPFCDLGNGADFKAGLLRLGNGLGIRGETHLHVDA